MYIEIELSGYCISDDNDGRWIGADILITEGNTLDELLADAKVYWTDQDGGEAGETDVDDSWMQDLVEEQYYKQLRNDASKTGS